MRHAGKQIPRTETENPVLFVAEAVSDQTNQIAHSLIHLIGFVQKNRLLQVSHEL